jgi:radical SAM additional 4Fe4S-binding domain
MALTISVTSDCNLNCRTCGGWDFTKHKTEKSQGALPFESIKQILDEGRKRGNRYLDITGGEPFLHPEIIKILTYAERSGYWTNVLTNGLLLDEKKIEALLAIHARLRLSLYSANKSTHEYFCGEGTFDPLKEAIRRLRENEIYFGVGMPVFKENVGDIKDTVRFALDAGCSFIRIFPAAKYYRAKDVEIDVSLIEEILSSIVEATIEHRAEIDLESTASMRIPNPIEMLTTRRCTAGCNYYHVDSEMMIHPCPYISDDGPIKIIKFNDSHDFDAMNASMDGYFERLAETLEGACRSCEYITTCVGGCLSEKTTRSIEPNQEQPICLRSILRRVMKKYDEKVASDILQSWVYSRFRDTFEDSGNRCCIRQLPIWNLSFIGRGLPGRANRSLGNSNL